MLYIVGLRGRYISTIYIYYIYHMLYIYIYTCVLFLYYMLLSLLSGSNLVLLNSNLLYDAPGDETSIFCGYNMI